MASNPNRIQPMEQPKSGKGKLVGTIGASATAILLVTVASWEGKANDPYADIVGKMTVCFGETNVAMRHYSDAECNDMLAGSLNGYARTVLARNPELFGHPNQLAATVSLTYNIGGRNYQRSTVAKRFSAGDWRGACNAFTAWSYAGGRQVKGLLNRRNAERAICLKGL